MRTRYAVSLAALLVVAAFCGAFAASHAPAADRSITAHAAPAPAEVSDAAPAAPAEPEPFQMPFPDKACPGVSATSKCCLWQVFKRGMESAQRTAQYDPPYACATGQTMLGKMTMKVPLETGGTACDPLLSLIPNGSVLEATGRVIRRADDFGDFNGDFVIRNPAGVVLFTGCIETLDRVGSHFPTCETCNPTSHYEGWLTGRGQGQLANYGIRASISAGGVLPSPAMPTVKTTPFFLNGTLMKCP